MQAEFTRKNHLFCGKQSKGLLMSSIWSAYFVNLLRQVPHPELKLT